MKRKLISLLILFSVCTLAQKAQGVVKVGPPCNFIHSIEYMNTNRSHWDGSIYDLDIDSYECDGDDVLASISGTVETDTESFTCSPLRGITVVNSILRITNSEGVKVIYRHQQQNYSEQVQSGIVQIGNVLASIGSVGCSTGPHIHFEVYQNGRKLPYSEWEFTEASKPNATTNSATNITSTSAKLNATVNPNGAATTITFEYWTNSSNKKTTSSLIKDGTNNINVSITISGLSPNTTYFYRVKASNSEGPTDGNTLSFTTGLEPPQFVTATKGNFSDKVMVWCFPDIQDAKYYRVYRSTNLSSSSASLIMDWQSITDRYLWYHDYTAVPGQLYYYWYKVALDSSGKGESNFSEAVYENNDYYNAGYAAPVSAPTNIKASDGTFTNAVRVSWDSVPGAMYYRVYREIKVPYTIPFVEPVSSWQSSTVYYDYSAQPGRTYHYAVQAATNTSGAGSMVPSGCYEPGFRGTDDFRIHDISIIQGSILSASPGSIEITFNNPVKEETLTNSTIILLGSGGDKTFHDGNEVVITPHSIDVLSPEQVSINLQGQFLPDDVYQLRLIGGEHEQQDLSMDEAAFLALELSGAIQAPSSLIETVFDDLNMIRANYPMMYQIRSESPDWIPGSLLISLTSQAKQQYDQGTYHGLDNLHAKYGPVQEIKSPSWNILRTMLLKFDYPYYNMELLGQLYRQANGVEYIEVNSNPFSKPTPQTIRTTTDIVRLAQNQYQFTYNWGESTCTSSHSWIFTIDNGNIMLNESSGDNIPEEFMLEKVRDIYGHPLDGEFYGEFPSGNDENGGDFSMVFAVDTQNQNIMSSQGGEVALSDNSVSLDFAPNAISQDVYVFIEEVPFSATPPVGANFQVLGHAYEISSRQILDEPVTNFSEDIVIMFTYDPAELNGMNEQDLAINYYDETLGEWLELPSTVDTANHTVTTIINHFTMFALLAPAPSVTPTIPTVIPDEPTPYVNPPAVPEPGTLALTALGLLSLFMVVKRSLKNKK